MTMNECNSAIFFPQAEKICSEVFENLSDKLFIKLGFRTFENDSDTDSSPFYSVVLQNQVTEELKKEKYFTLVSNSFNDDNNTCFFILYLNPKYLSELEEHSILYDKIAETLFNFLIDEWNSENTYFYNGSTSSIIIKQATDSLVTEISKQCCNYNDFALYENLNLTLLNIFNSLAFLTYEKGITEGLIHFTNEPENIVFLFEFESPENYGTFSMNNLKLIRKLLELTDSKEDIGIISDTNKIYGIGKNKSAEIIYSVSFSKDHRWTLYKNNTELLTMKNNLLTFSSTLLDKKSFIKYAENIFPKAKDTTLHNIYSIIHTLCNQQKGTILVIKSDAEQFVKKYQDLAILTKPVKLTSDNVKKLSSVDGAIIMDDNCICHGFGAVLDGLDTGCGNRARGSRFNSSERFYNLYKNDSDTGLLIFILSDDGNFNFFPPMED